MIDILLRCGGYDNPRQYIGYRYRGRRTNNGELSKSVVLKLPYISERVSDEIRKFIRNRDLPVDVIFKPGVKLQELFCSSRPHDKRKCTLADCKICPNLPDSCDCTVEYPARCIGSPVNCAAIFTVGKQQNYT